MSEWKLFKLKDIGEVVTGSTPSTKNREYYNGNMPFYSPADFHGTVYCNKTEKSISKEALLISRPIPKNAIMFACIASVGKIAISSKIGITNQQINTLITNSDAFYYKFIYYILFLNRNKFIQFAPQTTIPIINKTDFSGFSFNIPTSLPEQQKIAGILSTVDAVIEKTEAAIAKYKVIKAGMMHDLFTRGIEDNGQLRPAYEDAPTRYKQTALGWIPKEWEAKRIDETLSAPIRDFGSFSMTNLINFVEAGIPFIKSESVQNGYIDFNKISYITKNVHDLLHKSIVKNGDILFTKIGAIGRVAIYEGQLGECNSNAATAKIKIDSEKFNDYYIAYKLGSEKIMREFEKHIISTPPRINLGEINSMLIEVPIKEEQNKIVEKIKSITKKINIEQNTLNKYQKLKQGLMQDLLTGKVKVNLDTTH